MKSQCRAVWRVTEQLRPGTEKEPNIWARVAHVFGVIKRPWGFGKVGYCGLAKNWTGALTVFRFSNLYRSRQRVMAQVHPKVETRVTSPRQGTSGHNMGEIKPGFFNFGRQPRPMMFYRNLLSAVLGLRQPAPK
jgi:hypothetical protein